MYSADAVLQLQLKPSPSLAYNNLCPLGRGLAYSHTRAVGCARTAAAPAQARAGLPGQRR